MTRTDPHDCPTTPFGLPCYCAARPDPTPVVRLTPPPERPTLRIPAYPGHRPCGHLFCTQIALPGKARCEAHLNGHRPAPIPYKPEKP